MIGIVLARRYAKAVIDLAQEAGILKEVGEDLDRIARLFADSHELINIFADPTIATCSQGESPWGYSQEGRRSEVDHEVYPRRPPEGQDPGHR